MSQIETESKEKNFLTHFDFIITIWALAIGAFVHWSWFPIFMVAGGITFLYLLLYLDKHGIFSQMVRDFLSEIDIISFPIISKNQTIFKAMINVVLLVLIYVVADWINIIGIFYLFLALYIAFFIMYMQAL